MDEIGDTAVIKEKLKVVYNFYKFLDRMYLILVLDLTGTLFSIYFFKQGNYLIALLLFIAFAPTIEDFIKYYKNLFREDVN